MNFLQELDLVAIIFRIFLSILLGGLLGIERERKNSPAGFRTNILVCLGATMVMMTNQYICMIYNTGDPSRMGAQVISGIGFLGAGTIIVTGKNQIRGITTAACLWTTACCGLAVGVGFYSGAIVGSVSIAFVITTLRKIDKRIRQKSKYLEVYVEYKTGEQPFSDFIRYVRKHDFEIINIQLGQEYLGTAVENIPHTGYLLTLVSNRKIKHDEMTELLSREPGISYIEEL